MQIAQPAGQPSLANASIRRPAESLRYRPVTNPIVLIPKML